MKEFEKAKVGDKVYCLIHGEGKIISILHNIPFPIEVHFNGRGVSNYTLDGKINITDNTPRLYWSKPEIIAPERPRRLIDKVITKYCNIYKESDGTIVNGLIAYNDKSSAIHQACKKTNVLFEGAEVTIKFKIEE